MTRPTAIGLSVAGMAVHNREEVFGMGRFPDAHRGGLPPFLRSLTGERFAVSLVLASAAVLVLAGPFLMALHAIAGIVR